MVAISIRSDTLVLQESNGVCARSGISRLLVTNYIELSRVVYVCVYGKRDSTMGSARTNSCLKY